MPHPAVPTPPKDSAVKYPCCDRDTEQRQGKRSEALNMAPVTGVRSWEMNLQDMKPRDSEHLDVVLLASTTIPFRHLFIT